MQALEMPEHARLMLITNEFSVEHAPFVDLHRAERRVWLRDARFLAETHARRLQASSGRAYAHLDAELERQVAHTMQ